MKKFVSRLLLFSVCAFLVYLIFLSIWPTIFPDFLQKNLPYKETTGFLSRRINNLDSIIGEREKIDILFLGSSRSYRHYDPRIFDNYGFKAFNLGSSAQTFLQTEILIKKYVKKLKPKIVLIDVYPGMFMNDGVESTIDFISNDNDPWQYFGLALHQNNIKIWNCFFYSKIHNVFNINPIQDKEEEDKYIEGGFVQKELSYARESKEIIKDSIQEDQLKAFKNLIRYLRKNKINFIMVHSPIQTGIRFENISGFREIMNRNNIKYYDFSHLNQIDDSLNFFNPTHMNQKGVHIYDKLILDSLFLDKDLISN